MKISMKNRKIGYTYSSVSGHFAFRNEKSIAFESTLERDLLTLLEFNSSVFDVTEQPVTIEYQNKNGREVTYTPDFLVIFNDPNNNVATTKISTNPWLIEVKPREILIKKLKELKPKLKIASTLNLVMSSWVVAAAAISPIPDTARYKILSLWFIV